jgi:hypothetical protein
MTFPSYLEMPERVPRAVWHVLRACTVAGSLVLVVGLVVEPHTGLRTVWKSAIRCSVIRGRPLKCHRFLGASRCSLTASSRSG